MWCRLINHPWDVGHEIDNSNLWTLLLWSPSIKTAFEVRIGSPCRMINLGKSAVLVDNDRLESFNSQTRRFNWKNFRINAEFIVQN